MDAYTLTPMSDDVPRESEAQGARISALGTHTFATRVLVYLLGAVTSILIARALGPEGRGHYYLPVTIVTIAYYIANMGTQQAQFRLWSRRAAPAHVFATSDLLLSAILGTTVAGITWFFYVLTRDSLFADVDAQDIALVIPVIPFMVHSLLVSGFLILNRRLQRANMSMLAGAAAQTIGTVVLYALDRLTVEAVLLLFLVSVVLPWLLMLTDPRRVGRFRRPLPWRFMRRQLRLGAQIEPSILFSYLNLRMDVLFIARYLDLAAVGIYSVAVIFGELMWLATDSVTSSVRERQANAPREEAVDVTARAVRMNVLLAIVLGAAIAVTCPLAIRLLFPAAFSPASSVVWWLVPAGVAMAVWRPSSSLVLRFAAPALQPLIAGISLGVNVVGNLLLIPEHGIIGAAAASLLSYSTGAALTIFFLGRTVHLHVRELLPGRAEVKQLVETLRRPSVKELGRLSRL